MRARRRGGGEFFPFYEAGLWGEGYFFGEAVMVEVAGSGERLVVVPSGQWTVRRGVFAVAGTVRNVLADDWLCVLLPALTSLVCSRWGPSNRLILAPTPVGLPGGPLRRRARRRPGVGAGDFD